MIEAEKPTSGFLNAKVNAQVIVDEEGRLEVSLHIEAENKTCAEIKLDEKYRIPLRYPYGVKASDGGGILQTFNSRSLLEVEFRDGTILPPGEKYWWNISFGTYGYLKKTEEGKDIIIGPYVVKPQEAYKGVPIRDHEFTYKFIFEKPKPAWLWLFKKNYVHQVNSREVHAVQKRRLKVTEYSFEPFHLGAEEAMKISFARIYRFSSKLVAILTAILTAIITALLGVALQEAFIRFMR